MIIRKYLFILLLFPCLLINGQASQEIIKNIRKNFQTTNADTTLKKLSLDGEEFLDHVPDGGGELTGFFKNDSIVKISEWIGLSYGNRVREYYYKSNKLIFVYEKFQSFVQKNNGELDHDKIKTTFEGRYYFDKDKLIEQKISGKRTFEDNSSDVVKDLQEEAKNNFNILSGKKKLR
jgi:hypothetical protein